MQALIRLWSSCTFTFRSTGAPTSAACDSELESSGLGTFSKLQFSLLWFPETLATPPFAFPFPDFIVLFSFAELFILAAHVLFSPLAAILSEVAGGYLIHQA